MALFKKGSIDGVKYYFLGHDSKLGRKYAVHQIVNAGKYVEDLGPHGGDFVIHAVITDTTDSGYNQAKKRLEGILNKAGSKALIHPVYGSKRVFFTDCSLTETIAETRKAIYTLACLETDADIYPTQGANDKSWINKKFDEAMKALEDNFPGLVAGANAFVAGYNDFRANISDLTETLEQGTEFINGLGDEASAFTTDLLKLRNSVTSLIQAPSQLATRLRNVYDNLTLIVTDPKDLITVAKNLTDSTNDAEVPGDSYQSNVMNDTRKAIKLFNDAALLAIACQASTVISYLSEEEVTAMKAQLGLFFTQINPDVDDNVYNALQDLTSETIRYLETLSPQLPKIVTIRVNQIPASVLSYKLYGTTERMDEIVNLNNIADPAYVNGTIKILSR